ncbi:c-type cytochrome [Aurantimonas sp. VKM B-3413]|uniref:c-type cytochrome n=1 Tax=Aurantimonas sp. VKM B-3413 TaxID=2779401 RepID=UPI001E400709|nr:c-type cytochrome [Aurantimonas sp. VKM B-3413]MCB8836427.1 c-type cytochrome [Aurantimonas sp. VKM B-3413]
MQRSISALLAGFMFLAPANAQTALDAAAGRKIAERWCAGCHIVGPEQKTGTADVLTFMAIAKKTGNNVDSLAAFLANPHPVMADINLTQREIRELVAYIASLR